MKGKIINKVRSPLDVMGKCVFAIIIVFLNVDELLPCSQEDRMSTTMFQRTIPNL